MASLTDYRRLAQHRRGMYFLGDDRDQLLHETFKAITNNQPIGPTEVQVQMGRKLTVPEAGAVPVLCGHLPTPLCPSNTCAVLP